MLRMFKRMLAREADKSPQVRIRTGSQNDRILKMLRDGKVLTQLDGAIMGIPYFTTRISELRRMGHPIKSRKARSVNGARINQYFL